MKQDDLESRMRQGEYFHSQRMWPRAWAVVRVDGRAFSALTEQHYQKPFDPRFHADMSHTATALLEALQGQLAYTESDEISVLLRPEWDLFDREVEKLVSLSAGIASAAFTLQTQRAAHFDARIWMAASFDEVLDYFRWRQSDAARCALNGAAYWALRKEGLTESQATRQLEGKAPDFKHELLFQRGVHFNALPVWQRRGVGLHWESYTKDALNPKTGERVQAWRRRIAVDEDIPYKEAWAEWVRARSEPLQKPD